MSSRVSPTGRWTDRGVFWDLIGLSILVARPSRCMSRCLTVVYIARDVIGAFFIISDYLLLWQRGAEEMAFPGGLSYGYSIVTSRATGVLEDSMSCLYTNCVVFQL